MPPFLMHRGLTACLLTLSLFTGLYPAGNVSAKESLVPAGGKEIYLELFTADLSGKGATTYIGGHYTYYFADWFAAGPGFYVPPLDWSFFNLGVFLHSYFFPFPDWFVRPYGYLELGFHFTDLEYEFAWLGIDKQGSLWYWIGFIRPGLGLEIQVYRTSSNLVSARAMLYQHYEFLHLQYFRETALGLNLSVGITWSFF